VKEKNADLPHAKRRGQLKNGNPSGDPSIAPRCGATTRRHTSCLAPAMRNGRCRLHGGKSTGPRTPEGIARSKRANWIHGFYSAKEKAERASTRRFLKECHETMDAFDSQLEIAVGFANARYHNQNLNHKREKT
jgi:hypothetical protein